jgi:cell wall-associated NlpC family hydrolase
VLDGRKRSFARTGAAIAAVLVAVTMGLTGATPAAADPDQKDIDRAQAKADRLFHEAEVASERYNDAKSTLTETKVRLKSLNADLARQQTKVGAMRSQVAAMMVDQYQNDALSTASQVVLSNDPDAFLDNLSAVTSYNTQRGEVMSQYATEIDRLNLRKAAVRDEMSSVAALEKRLKSQKATVDAKAADAKEVLDGLKAEARKAMMSGSWDGPIPDASGRAGAALKYAMAQVGDAYVYGAAGPNAFDCSGLTMMAWGQAGVGLPHSSSAQFSSGPHVPESQLQPGDLVFYYSPISHVGMYIGNGMIVHAANPGAGVTTSPLHSMPYSGAVRPG